MAKKPMTTLTWTDTVAVGGKFTLIARQNRSDDKYVIEVYENVDGMEMFRGYLNREVSPEFASEAVKQIRKEIAQHPISEHSLMWLLCLNYSGLLADHTD